MSTLKEYRVEVTMQIVNSDGKPVDLQGRAKMEGKIFRPANTGYTVADTDSIKSAIVQMEEFNSLTKAVAYMIDQERYDGNRCAGSGDTASSNECDTCEDDGIYATNGDGPFDCFKCGKKAPVRYQD